MRWLLLLLAVNVNAATLDHITLDGTDDAVYVGATDAAPFQNDDDWTIFLAVRYDNIGNDSENFVLAQEATTSAFLNRVTGITTSNVLQVNTSGSTSNTTATLSTSAWYYVCTRMDGATGTIYSHLYNASGTSVEDISASDISDPAGITGATDMRLAFGAYWNATAAEWQADLEGDIIPLGIYTSELTEAECDSAAADPLNFLWYVNKPTYFVGVTRPGVIEVDTTLQDQSGNAFHMTFANNAARTAGGGPTVDANYSIKQIRLNR